MQQLTTRPGCSQHPSRGTRHPPHLQKLLLNAQQRAAVARGDELRKAAAGRGGVDCVALAAVPEQHIKMIQILSNLGRQRGGQTRTHLEPQVAQQHIQSRLHSRSPVSIDRPPLQELRSRPLVAFATAPRGS